MSHSEDPKKESRTLLTADALAMMLEEVSAMVRAGRPLLAGFEDLADNSVGNLGRAANAVRSKMEQGATAADSLATLSPAYQAPIAVAMETMATTGSSEPIHETARMIRETKAEQSRTRFAAISPLLNVIVGAAILFFVIPWILVSMSEAKLIKSAFAPSIIEICQTFAGNFTLAAFATVSVVSLFSIALFRAASRSSIRNDWRYQYAQFCRWVAMQINPRDRDGLMSVGETELSRVVQRAAQVAGPEFAKTWQPVVQNIHSGAQSQSALQFPENAPEPIVQCVLDLISGTRDGASVGLDLRRLDQLYRQKSRKQRRWWTRVWPLALSWLLMLAFIFILLRCILAPLLDVVKERSF